MMATEPTINQPDASLTEPAPTQSAATSHIAQHAGHSSATLNGGSSDVNKQFTDIIDELVNSAEVSVSGGSDTESSKARLGDKNHARNSSSIKKPQSFKSVSVNRTFLASKAATSSTTRPDAPSGSASSTPQPTPTISASRLKLVAKSGSSLGGSTKTLSGNGKPASAPDPNTVWNRNKPVPQPEQKKLSDEELMHKYGIHMAGRLGPEDTKGQSNWADIDDDEEWEPETITWTDGTKITLPHENIPSPSIVHATLDKEPVPPPPKPKSPAPITSAAGSPSVKPNVLASGKSLVLKGAPEKPTLVAKPPAPPTPAKSPWARLPPIEKVTPGHLDTSNVASASQNPPWDSIRSARPLPTKEIAADDFSRSGFRDGQVGNHSQLFNSHSGRYEPVTDRRDSRNDIHARQPAVLQRPQYHDQQGPAEPSAAFQTSRTSGQEGPYRRRGSSNVSGTSGIMAHKLGKPYDIPPPEPFQSRAGSVVGGAESSISAHNQHTPRLPLANPYPPRPSPGQTHAVPYYSTPAVEPLSEDDIMQKKIMRERREQAIKLRLEQEAREEEARKARIAEKLKAMGPAPERKSAKKEGKSDNSVVAAYGRQTSAAANLEVQSGRPSDVMIEHNNVATNTSVDNRVNGASKQPGQADKTQSQTVQTANAPNTQSATPWLEKPTQSERYTSWGGGHQNTSRNVWGAPGNDRSLGNGTFNPDLGTLPDSRPTSINERNHRPAPIGPPRTGQQPVRPEPMSDNRLAPIGPPRGRPSTVSQGPEQNSANPWQAFAANVKEDDLRRARELQERINAQKNDAVISITEDWRAKTADKAQIVRHGPASMSSNALSNHSESRQSNSSHFASRNAEAISSRDGRPANDHTAEFMSRFKNLMASDSQDARAMVPRDDKEAEPTAEEISKWKGLMPSDFQARANAKPVAGKEPSGKEARKANGNRPELDRQSAAGNTRRNAPASAAQPRSSSRFFPPTRESHLYDDREEQARTKSPTPPPPTADGHPVFDGDVTRPHVSLPPARPVVKLPPSISSAGPSPVAPSAKPAPISFAAAAAAPVKGHQQSAAPRPSSRGKGYGGIPQKPHEIASQENWQDKINSLMGKKSTPPVKSMAVDSSSRIALEHTHSYDPATVALPGLSHSVSSLASENSDYTSKEMAEECFGEQEMGSLPAVRLPSEAPDALWQAVELNFDPTPARLRVDPICAEPLRFPGPEVAHGKSVIRVSAPFMTEAKTVLMPFANSRSNSNQRRSGPRGGARRLSGRGGQRGGREHSDHLGDHSLSHPPSRPSTRSGRGGGYRPRTENMSRNGPGVAAAQW